MSNSADSLQRFSFDHTAIRGELTHLNTSYRDVLKRHNYPPVVARAVGELMAATALLSGSLKFAGRLTLQIRLTGNITLLQAETNEKGQLRAIARYDDLAEQSELKVTDGQMIITIEPEVGQRYQGITLISGGNVAGA
ncbi:MAG: redox-regulated molecular chaperone Hsp33, partial [Thalassolituus sp.]